MYLFFVTNFTVKMSYSQHIKSCSGVPRALQIQNWHIAADLASYTIVFIYWLLKNQLVFVNYSLWSLEGDFCKFLRIRAQTASRGVSFIVLGRQTSLTVVKCVPYSVSFCKMCHISIVSLNKWFSVLLWSLDLFFH